MKLGRLQIKTEHRLAQERTAATQSVAYSTERKLTNNAEQKNIIKSWKDEGAGEFKKKTSDLIAQTASDMTGINSETMWKATESKSTSISEMAFGVALGNKMKVGAMRRACTETTGSDGKRSTIPDKKFPTPMFPFVKTTPPGITDFNWGSGGKLHQQESRIVQKVIEKAKRAKEAKNSAPQDQSSLDPISSSNGPMVEIQRA